MSTTGSKSKTKPKFTAEEEARIQKAVDDHKAALREKEIQAEIQRRIDIVDNAK